MERFELSTSVGASAEAVWQRVTTPDGINDEMTPAMRMKLPASMRGRSIADLSPGTHVGRSWLLLVIPGLPWLLRTMIERFFHHRHRRIVRFFTAR